MENEVTSIRMETGEYSSLPESGFVKEIFFNGACFEQFKEQSSLATKRYRKFNAQTSPKDLKDLIVQLVIFPDPSDFDRCCKLKDRLPSIVVEPTEGEVESGELRWPPEEFLVQEDEQDNCEETAKESKEQ
ncbi:hypothetical protein HPG69_009019 [Diceros bicornis minor]|uniref:Protein LBH n=1 Tax=Diceros bicornis minor TaxID=77932 RepID=A0A7J7EBF0_DICBM|nr:hypothetical protein HPG69_009019 [Diceros bicornis minor]